VVIPSRGAAFLVILSYSNYFSLFSNSPISLTAFFLGANDRLPTVPTNGGMDR